MTLIKLFEEPMIEENNQTIEQAAVEAQIAQFLIDDLLSLDEFLTRDEEVIIGEDEGIFVAIVEHYSVDKLDEEEEEIDTEIGRAHV